MWCSCRWSSQHSIAIQQTHIRGFGRFLVWIVLFVREYHQLHCDFDVVIVATAILSHTLAPSDTTLSIPAPNCIRLLLSLAADIKTRYTCHRHGAMVVNEPGMASHGCSLPRSQAVDASHLAHQCRTTASGPRQATPCPSRRRCAPPNSPSSAQDTCPCSVCMRAPSASSAWHSWVFVQRSWPVQQNTNGRALLHQGSEWRLSNDHSHCTLLQDP